MNIYDLISRAQKLRKETQLDSVSPDRVGGLHEDTLKYINEFQLLASSPSLHKIYASVSAMQSDKSPKSDLTGKPLKPGQLVVIVPANQTDATAGDVYRYDGPSGNTSAWTFVAKIGAVPADAELSATSTNPPQNKVVTEKLTELESEVPEFGGKTLKYEVHEGYIKPCVLKKGAVYRVENQTSNTMSINLYSANERSSEHLVQEMGTISGGSYTLFEVESDNAKYIGGYATAKGYIAISVDSDIRKDLNSAALTRKRTHTLSVSSESEKRIWGNLCFAKDTTYLITINVVSLSDAFTFRIQDKNGNAIVPSVEVRGKGVKEYTFECNDDYDNLFGRFYFNGAANVSVSIVEQKIRQNSIIELDIEGIHTLSNLDSKTAELELNTILTCNGKNYELSGKVNMKNNVVSTGTWLILNLDDSSLNVVNAFEHSLKNNEVVIATARHNYGSNLSHLYSFNALFRYTIDGSKQDKGAIYNTLSVLNDSENLFDVTRAIKGRFDGFGKIVDEGIYDQLISDYIPCHGKEYISSNHGGRDTDYIAFYDGELKIIQTVLSTQKAFKIPSNAYYVRMTASVYNSTGYIAFVNNAELSADDYVPYKGYGWVANYVKNLSELNLVTKEEILTLQATEGIYAWEYQYTGADHSSTKDKFAIRIKGNKLKVRMLSSSDDAPNAQMFLNGNGSETTLTIGKVYDIVLPNSYNWNEDVLVGFYIVGGKPNQTLKFEIYTEGSRLVDEQAIRSKAFCDLFNDTQEADSYLYFTDPHTAAHGFNVNRFDKHIATIKKIADGNPIQMVMCGGDWLSNVDTQEEACESLGYIGAKMKCFDVPSCLVVGNHDTNYLGKLDANSENGTGRLIESTIGNLWFGHYKTYYAHKTNMTRFYVLDTGTDSEHVDATELTLYQSEQLKWLCESLISNDDIHNVLSFHIYFVLEKVPLFLQQIVNVAAAYNNRGKYSVNEETFDFSSTGGTIHCCICGHHHRDFVEINKGIPIISTTIGSDYGELGQMNGDGSKVNLDLVLLDYTHKKFKSIRIGDGENREIDIL